MVESLKEHRIITVFGDVRIKRRLYRDSNGKHCFLLDEKMGLNKGCQVSPKVKELATYISQPFSLPEVRGNPEVHTSHRYLPYLYPPPGG